ncbi:TTN, partial [Symbiodinium sp. CCMP2456]
RYYYAFAYVAGPEGGLNGTLSPPVEIFVPTVSNDFSQPPQLVATARQDHVQFTFSAVQQFGVAWATLLPFRTIESVKSFANAAGGSNCRREALSIGTAVKEILLASSFPNAGDGCDLTTNGMYVLAVYVEDINGLNDGTLAQLPVHISPRPTVSNRIAAGPVISANPTPSDVHLTFSAAIPGRYWAFILPTDRTNVFTLETAKFMDLNPDTVGQAGCRKNDVEMGSGATEVHLTDCDLVMSGPGITFYSAFIYVEDNSGQVGDLSAAVTVVGISNTFLPPFPRIVAFETDGKISVDVRVNNSGRLWSRIVYSDLYPSIERYSGAMSLTVLKQWQDYPDNGPSYQNENCSIFELDVTAERDFEGLPVPVWLNFSNCTFTSGTNYMIAIYAEDAGGNNDGEIIGLKLDKYYNASNYFIASPSVVGTAMAETFTVQFQTWAAGFGWCAIISPQDAKYLTGAAVMSGEASLGGPNCCKNSAGFLTGGGLETLTLTGCGLSMDTEYLFFMYISGGALDGTLSSGHAFTTFGSLGHIRVQWLQKETDEGGAIDRYRVFLNGTQVYDDYGYRSSLEQARAGSPPRWVRVADLACTPGLSYEVTLSGRNLGGWSPLSEPLQTGCFLRPGTISELREVSSSVSADRETASLRLAWNAPQDAAGAETAYYNVYRDRGLRQALFELIGSTAVTQFDDSGLVPGRDYGYQVTAVNAFGEGPVSDVLFLKVAGTPVIETPKVDLLGILNQAGLQMTPTAQTGELDQARSNETASVPCRAANKGCNRDSRVFAASRVGSRLGIFVLQARST